jgi:hypothetical protein
MDCGEAIPCLDRVSWPGNSDLNNARRRPQGRQPGSDDPATAKTPGEALSYIELLYKSGRTENLASLLRRSQVFRAAWLILQQSSSDMSQAAAPSTGSSSQGETLASAHLPVPASGPPSTALKQKPASSAPEAGRIECLPQTPASADSGARNSSFTPRALRIARSLTSLFQAYQNQDLFCARELQLGQLVSIKA